jgi:hypothetical protein
VYGAGAPGHTLMTQLPSQVACPLLGQCPATVHWMRALLEVLLMTMRRTPWVW